MGENHNDFRVGKDFSNKINKFDYIKNFCWLKDSEIQALNKESEIQALHWKEYFHT